MRKPKETFYFFTITNAASFKTSFKTNVIPLVTSAATIIDTPANQPAAFMNVAFSQSGLTALGITDNLGDTQFAAGQYADATALGDTLSNWATEFQGTNIHGVFLIGSDSSTSITNKYTQIQNYLGTSVSVVKTIEGSARPGTAFGHERECGPQHIV